jgi:D-alanine-D-alanine ligase
MGSSKKLRVGIIFGGRSCEHEVSLMSARSVLNALDPEKYEITQIGISHRGEWLVGDDTWKAFSKGELLELARVAIMPDPTAKELFVIQHNQSGEIFERLTELDVVFPVLHGTFGEDGTLQGLFELADLAYVGAGVLGSSLAMDKGVFKDVMIANDIPVVESTIVLRGEIESSLERVLDQAERVSEYPLFVKPANMGSSVGITRCLSRSDLIEGLIEAARYDRRVLIEKGLDSREIEVSVLGNQEPAASVPGEIIPSREFYSYEAKYVDDESELLIPAPLSEEMSKRVRELSIKAYRAIDCAGMARVDFLLEKDDSDSVESPQVYLNEINTIPGFTKISMYPKLWEASGIPYSTLVDQLIELALERKSDRDRTVRRYEGAG